MKRYGFATLVVENQDEMASLLNAELRCHLFGHGIRHVAPPGPACVGRL